MANELSLITVGGITYDIKDSLARETLNTILPSFFDANGHEYVEIAGIKWATMNIGARAVTDSGLYFQWGDTQGYTASQVGSKSGKKAFKWADYKYCDGTASVMTKYNSTDSKTVLEISDDAVADVWGGSWRMPTTEEFQALSEAVNAEWTTNYEGSGVKGLVLTDKTDSSKKLFFPAAGFADFGSVSNVNSGGKYWSSSLNSNNNSMAKFVSFSYMFNTLSVNWNSYNSRCQGTSVRGVLGTSDPQPLHKVAFSGDYDDLTNKPEVSLCVNKTYSELKALRDNSQLKPGQWYRIIDYTTTTVQTNTQSAGHAFDVIVRADSANVINENAYAALHSGDTYFSTAGAKLEAWELKYCLDNDTNRFAWADSTNGKGVIWWMKDEHDNECPYDFKNIQFKWTSAKSQSGIKANVFYYTFSVATGTNDASVTDHSLNGAYCYGNKMGAYISYKQQLNSNVFRNTSENNESYFNTFENNCRNNTFGKSCYYNTFGKNFCNNTFAYSCSYNTFGIYCTGNTFGNSCTSNMFGISCSDNTFGNICTNNTFWNYCYYNTFGNECKYNIFGNYCYYIKFGTSSTTKDYCQYIIVENGNKYIYLDCSAKTSWQYFFQNVKIAQGVNNTNSYKTITHTTASDTFQTVYKPANSVEVSV